MPKVGNLRGWHMAKTGQSAASGNDIWNKQSIFDFAPDDASIVAALKVLKKGGFGTVEATADGKGWWVVCQGITDIYQVSARIADGQFACDCTCPSPKYPCKHALALLLHLCDHSEERAEPEAPKFAPSDFEALVRSVFQNPEDDTPRLVFADFLEENNEPDRAALIRLQCELARERARSPRAAELRKEVRGLAAKVRRAAVDPLPEGVGAELHRGFLHLTTDLYAFREVGSLPARFTALFQAGWVEVVRIGGYVFDHLNEDHATLFSLVAELDMAAHPMHENALLSVAAHFAEMRAAGRLCRVKVAKHDRKAFEELLAVQQGETVANVAGPREEERYYGGLTPQSLDLLIKSGRLRAARRLTLHGRVGDRGAELLASADLTGVTALTLDAWECSPEGLRRLADSIAFAGLTELGVTACRVGAAGVAAVVSGAATGGLMVLSLSYAQLDDAAAEELARAIRLRNLVRLALQGNDFTPIGLRQILQSPNLPALAHIDITGNAIVDSYFLRLLLDATPRPELRLAWGPLALTRLCGPDGDRVAVEHQTEIRDDLFGRLAGCSGAKCVTSFRVTRASIGPEAVRAIAASFSPAVLKELELRDVPLRNEGVEYLTAAFKDYQLETLRLPFCRVQASGVTALSNSSMMASAKVLDLSGNTIGKGGADALAKSPHLGSLEKLVLTDWKVGLAERKLLKDRFGKRLEL